MKNLPFVLLLLVIATPAAAQRPVPRNPKVADAARLLTSPAAQDLIAAQIASLADIILDTKVGPLAALSDPRDDVRPDDTLHSVQRRHDPDYDRHLYERSRHAVATGGAAVGGAMAEAAELRQTADRLRAALTPLIDAARTLSSQQNSQR
ncbi:MULTISPECIES: hypothetical protein [unclassified Sphingomonas]|uniref:hypothetical protein n=1 Tax=unclassified Sphingomonas TaxID=196159 RepID=UPI002269EFB6|nr:MULTISPECIES: hypothetical protein [unclassified Sphingomonas]